MFFFFFLGSDYYVFVLNFWAQISQAPILHLCIKIVLTFGLFAIYSQLDVQSWLFDTSNLAQQDQIWKVTYSQI